MSIANLGRRHRCVFQGFLDFSKTFEFFKIKNIRKKM